MKDGQYFIQHSHLMIIFHLFSSELFKKAAVFQVHIYTLAIDRQREEKKKHSAHSDEVTLQVSERTQSIFLACLPVYPVYSVPMPIFTHFVRIFP